MKIFATGDERRIAELKLKFGDEVVSEKMKEGDDNLNYFDAIFHLNADDKDFVPDNLPSPENKLVLVCSVKKTLSSIIREANNKLQSPVVGMNLLPSFINRSKAEVCFHDESSGKAFEKFSEEMKMEFLEVEDHVGMVTPRVICMIINEACFSLQEDVASIADIDKAMKLGTSYPYGPFEWCDRIGVKDVYETLVAMWNDTNDRRYEISDLLKERYQSREPFYK